jgi:hypothetical protein
VKVVAWLHGAIYRVRQFGSALATRGRPLTEADRTEVRAWLPATARPLFDAMPHNDQHHSLNVLRSLCAAGHPEPALMQAALLHDAAKSTGGVNLFHRVALVLIKIVWPDWLAYMAQAPSPARGNLRYPFWVLANHPRLGAELAAAAGCDPLAVTLIRRHQETGRGAEDPLRGSGGDVALLLTALRTADDDN